MAVLCDAEWEALRRAYEAGDETVLAIAKRFGVARGTIQRRARVEGWLPRPIAGRYQAPPEDVVILRLYRTIDRQLAQLEARMNSDDPMTVADHERETRALGQLIRNFEKVSGLEGDQPGGGGRKRRARNQPDAGAGENDPHRLREELAERILKLREKQPPDQG